MASPLLFQVTCVLVVLIVGFGQIIPLAEADIPCGSLQLTVAPCIGYLTGPAGRPIPAACCNGVKRINNQAKSTPDRRSVCTCLKNSVLSVPGINVPRLSALARNCGVHLPYKVTPSINCNTIP
ncbi:non-specific lipid-transfer protein 1 [Vigna radiata var. radiata]|uniref:Non-specific lipid-transfer protein n=1 Tax=Vigna radiata var. radiata TaxID=3916 RepID=A0A1S3TUY9_VIGRR|nr:non-specific lipid-transfer protein 1 [Vigna radiata var. radiata]